MSAVCIAAGYAFLGAGWLILKAEGALQIKAVRWARISLIVLALGMVAVSLATPLTSQRIFDRWFSMPAFMALAPIPLVTAVLFALIWRLLGTLPRGNDAWSWAPFAGGIGLFVLGFHGLAYSFYPYIVPERLTFWQAASAPESLMIIFVGAIVMIPVIAAYSAFSFWVFRGKATALTYH
jgi:cytochrome d ubiquinol oxidase subunit II